MWTLYHFLKSPLWTTFCWQYCPFKESYFFMFRGLHNNVICFLYKQQFYKEHQAEIQLKIVGNLKSQVWKVVKRKSRQIGYFLGYVTVITTSLPQIKIRGKEFLQCYNLRCDCLFPQWRKIPGLISNRKDGFTFSIVRMLYFRSNIHSV